MAGKDETVVIEMEALVGLPMATRDRIHIEAGSIPDLVPGGMVESILLVQNTGQDMLSILVEAEATDGVSIGVSKKFDLFGFDAVKLIVTFTAPKDLTPGKKVGVTYRVYEDA